jgi:hypothetical protein
MMIGYSESTEYRTATRRIVLPTVVYWGLLDRVPTAQERTDAAAILAGGGGTATLVEAIVATPEWATHVD